MKKTIGLVIGKFMPLHKGHEAMIRFADSMVDQLFVVVDNIRPCLFSEGYIPGEKRVEWIKKLLPNAKVVYIGAPTPQQPSEHIDFWNVWKNILLDITGVAPDYLVASEDYGFQLSEVLACKYIPFDMDRDIFNVCASDIRKNLFTNFHYLSDVSKTDFIAKICIVGPESTGKSTLTKQLAKLFDTVSVPEYARTFTESYTKKSPNFQFNPSDMYSIGMGQIALEESIIGQANRIMFSDTDVLLTTIWSKWLCDGEVETRLKDLVQKQKYDLYLLTYPDIEWQKDDIRYFPKEDERIKFFQDTKDALDQIGAKYVVIKGEGQERLNNTKLVVDDFMKKYNYSYFVDKMGVVRCKL